MGTAALWQPARMLLLSRPRLAPRGARELDLLRSAMTVRRSLCTDCIQRRNTNVAIKGLYSPAIHVLRSSSTEKRDGKHARNLATVSHGKTQP